MENQNKQSAVEVVNKELLDEIFNIAAGTPSTPPTTQEPTKTEEEAVVEAEKKKTAEPTPKVEEPKPTPIQSDYSKKLKSLIEDGIIENFSITVNDNDEQKEVFIEDIEDLTEEGYKQILEGWKNAKDEDIKSKYISVDGLDETTKKLIEIKRAGGDISQIIEKNVSAIETLSKLKENIDNEQVQINIVAHSLQQKGLSQKVVEAQIKDYIDSGILETEATTIIDTHLSAHQTEIENKKNAELQREIKEKEDLKTLRKTLTSTYKDMNLPENIHKVLVDNATKLDQDKISNTDKLYFEAIKDPQRFAEINFFLNNPEEYKKFISSQKVIKAKTENAKSLFSININKTNKPKTSASTLVDVADEIINNSN
jgi:hypothetical protein